MCDKFFVTDVRKKYNTTAQSVPIKQDIFIMKLYNMYSLDGQWCCFSGHDATTSFLYVLRHQMSFFGIMDGKTVSLTVLTGYQTCRPWVWWHTQILTDQLTLFQPGRDGLCSPNYYWNTRIFRPSDGLYMPSYGKCMLWTTYMIFSKSLGHEKVIQSCAK